MKDVRNGRGKDNGKIRKNMEERSRSVYSSRSEIIVNLNEMRCSWSNAPQPITSTAADTDGHVDRVLYITTILMLSLCWIGMEYPFHSASLFGHLTDLPCSTGTRAESCSNSRGVVERDGQTPCT